MIQTTSPTLMDRSRLVSLLTELSTTKLNSADYNLAERLGHLIGLSGSINLAHALRQQPQGVIRDLEDGAESLQQEVLSAREKMMRKIASSFEHEIGESQNKVPTANVAIRAQALQTYDPYQRFYTTYQIEIAVEVQRLRAMVRKGISGVSASLGQLAELDRTLEESLIVHNRKLFNVTPKLLEKRFKRLLQAYKQSLGDNDIDDELSHWLRPGAWLELFYRDLRELLLAEFDVRLQPVFGLLEALNEQTKTT